MNSLIDYIASVCLRGFGVGIRRIPLPIALRLGRGIGFLSQYCIKPKRRKLAYLNLKAAFQGTQSSAQLNAILKKMYQGFGEDFIQTLRIPLVDQAYVATKATITGVSYYQDALSRKKGGFFYTAHFGNWEYMNVFSAFTGCPIMAVARPQKMKRLDALLNEYRQSKGCAVIYKNNAVKEILSGLHHNRMIGILGDQSAGAKGIFTPFLGRIASTAPGAVILAMKTGSPLLPSFCIRFPEGKYRIEVNSPLLIPQGLSKDEAIKKGVGAYVKVLEQYIRTYPCHWLWLHNKWKWTPSRRVVILSDGKAGHLSQSKVVAQTMEQIHRERLVHTRCNFKVDEFNRADIWNAEVIDVEYKSNLARVMYLIVMWIFPLVRRWWWLGKFFLKPSTYETLSRVYADIVISCGSSLIPIHLCFADANNAKSVILMNPRPFGLSRFNLVIAPWHDGLKKSKNLIQIHGACGMPCAHTRSSELQTRIQGLGIVSPLVLGVLIGGDTKHVRLSEDKLRGLIEDLKVFIHDKKMQVLITTSRRSSRGAEALIEHAFGKDPLCKLCVIANTDNPPDTVPLIFSGSTFLIVTSESVSMITEAACSGKTVLVVDVQETGKDFSRRHSLFLHQMEKDNFIIRTTPQGCIPLIEAIMKKEKTTRQLDNIQVMREYLPRFDY